MVKSKKGVESIIAVVLVLMITIASASSFFFWYTRVQQSAQGKAEHSTTVFLNQMISCVKLPYADYNLLNNESEIQIQNCGTTSLDIGNGDDNVLITSEPCAFQIDSVNCDVCPFTIGPGALAKFKIRFNNITCSGTTKTAADVMADQGNLQHTITFSIDRTTATASKNFIPTNILSCTATLNDLTYIVAPPPTTACINYTITSDSNLPQTYSLSATSPPATCTVGSFYNGEACTGAVITQKTVPARGTATFSFTVNVLNGGPPPCDVVTVIVSNMVSTCTDSDLVTLIP